MLCHLLRYQFVILINEKKTGIIAIIVLQSHSQLLKMGHLLLERYRKQCSQNVDNLSYKQGRLQASRERKHGSVERKSTV